MTRVLISADMEGATGVSAWVEVAPRDSSYERFRRLLTSDVNAAVAGAFEGGATEVWVNEAHASMRNLLLEELDERAELIAGAHKPLSMMQGIEECQIAFLVAYHARAGEPGVLAHTFWDQFMNVEVNGVPSSEARINAALAGELGVPIGLVTGDDVICAEAAATFAGAHTAVVKYAIDNFSARCLSSSETTTTIRAAARAALQSHSALSPFRIDPPITIRIELMDASQASMASNLPSVRRDGSTGVVYESASILEAYGLLDAIGSVVDTVRS